uniref:Uncharacterized protein n=1 Tax=Arundo donax TaxID=35708 RepID=A0A0A8ZHK7_ARUDO
MSNLVQLNMTSIYRDMDAFYFVLTDSLLS